MTESENTMRIIATGVNYTSPAPADPSQSSLTLDPAVISTGFQDNGMNNLTAPGAQGLFPTLPSIERRELISPNPVPSQTSSNNWINFCRTVNKPLTNGQQSHSTRTILLIALGHSVDLPFLIPLGGSCNNAPIGVIPSFDNMPSSKFIFPPNFAALRANETFTVRIAVNHLETGWSTSSQTAFLSAPVMVNAAGDVMGHSHLVIEHVTGFGQTTPTDPRVFVYYRMIGDLAVNGVLSTDVAGGLPAGYYRIATYPVGANHQLSACAPILGV